MTQLVTTGSSRAGRHFGWSFGLEGDQQSGVEELQVQNSPHSLYPSFKKKNCPDFNQTHLFIINEILNEFKIFSNVLHKRFLVLFHGIFVCSI